MAMSSRPIALGFLLLLIVSAVKADSQHSSPYSDPAGTLEVVRPSNTKKTGQGMKAVVLSNLKSGEKYIPLENVKNIDWQINTEITFVFDGKLINSDETWTGRRWRSLTTPEGVTIGPFEAFEIFKAPDVSDLYQVKVTPSTEGTKELRFTSLNTDVAEVLINLNVVVVFRSESIQSQGEMLKAEVLSGLQSDQEYIRLRYVKNIDGQINREITFVFDGKLSNSDGTSTGRSWRSLTTPEGVTIGPFQALAVFNAPDVSDLYQVKVTPSTTGRKELRFTSLNTDVAEVLINLNVEVVFRSQSMEVGRPVHSQAEGERLRARVLRDLQSDEEYIPLGTVKNIDGQINTEITFVFDGKLINSDGTWTGRRWRSLTTPEGVTIGPFQALEVFKAPDVSDLYQVKVTPSTAGTKELRFRSLNTGVAEVLINLNVQSAQ